MASSSPASPPGVVAGCRQRFFAWLLSRLAPSTEQKWGLSTRKQQLFEHIKDGATVVELGVGTGPNLQCYGGRARRVIGVDPNTYMHSYAREAAARAGMPDGKLELVVGRAEALPLPDESADAVVCTHTLCSVADVAAALSEARRGSFIFLEHVQAAPEQRGLRRLQAAVNPLAGLVGAGCSVKRQTLAAVQAAGFSRVEAEPFDVARATWLQAPFRPHVAGVAVK